MIYSVMFGCKSDPAKHKGEMDTLVCVKSKELPSMDKVLCLLDELHGDDVDKSTVKIRHKPDWNGDGIKVYDLDERRKTT